MAFVSSYRDHTSILQNKIMKKIERVDLKIKKIEFNGYYGIKKRELYFPFLLIY